ncbi:MerR family transcriptional regulator [Microbacterium sp. KUDC0406]|uniref:MerR family transcriptional regulator n=1 Tax=Microbacterium sp. KUDC0406 TaxID=2909588 RepID=UPI001F1C205B|nr:MerR family transcriptional regulator [Microbacterium sp. KUDC0406]UJP10026.1 MerR family transcriptional regulator [Microbacterium sp. KUDC0406]
MDRMELMSIGDFARAVGLTPKALRIYDDLDLLPPAEVDDRTGYRFYGGEQMEQARLIAALRRVGMPLERIRAALTLPPAAIAAELTSFWRQTEADVRSRRTQVSSLVADLRSKESTMTTSRTPRTSVAHALGRGARDEQLDAVHLGEELWAVADGFHGTPSVADDFVRRLAAEPGPIGAERWDSLAAECVADLPDDGRGSTFTAVALKGDIATIAHLGDSRAWLMRDGVLRQLTTDHTEVTALLEDGRLSEEEARVHPRRAVLNRALGAGVLSDPDVIGVTVQRGDRLALTTDGVHALFPAEQLTALLAADDAEAAVAAVRDAVRDAGEPDNHAIVLIDVEG